MFLKGFSPGLALPQRQAFFGRGLGVGAGNVTPGSAAMGPGISKKFALLLTKKPDALDPGHRIGVGDTRTLPSATLITTPLDELG